MRRAWRLDADMHEDFGLIFNAALTLMALIIGFAFSMAMTRYDQRKGYEEAEANAISTEYLRADLLSADRGIEVRKLLRDYTEQRILFYTTRDERQLRQIDRRTAQLQDALWSSVVTPTSNSLLPAGVLVLSGMNEVLDSQGSAQAAWWNRIPASAWFLMFAIAVCCHLLIGYGARNARAERLLMIVMPLIVSIAFYLIADIDTPRGGIIRIQPDNLLSLAPLFHGP